MSLSDIPYPTIAAHGTSLLVIALMLYLTVRMISKRIREAKPQDNEKEAARLARIEPLWEKLFTYEYQVESAVSRLETLQKLQQRHNRNVHTLEKELVAIRTLQEELQEDNPEIDNVLQAKEKLELKLAGLLHQQKNDSANMEAIIEEYANREEALRQLCTDINAKKLWLTDDAANAMQAYAQQLDAWLDAVMKKNTEQVKELLPALEEAKSALTPYREEATDSEPEPA